jgi:Icc protein
MSTVRLVQFTDPHLFGDPGQTLRGLDTRASLERTLLAARAAVAAADAVLVTGDLVQDDPAGYVPFRQIFGALGKPVYCVPGNHDDVITMSRVLASSPFVLGGHADHGAWRLVLLDSTVPGDAGGRLSAAALESLDDALRTSTGKSALVFLHHHPVDMRSRWLDEVGLENAAEFFAVLDRHAHVRAVAWGHVHQAHDAQRKSVRLLATPSTCAQFLPGSVDFALDTLPPAYREFTLHADGRLETQLHFVA